MSQDVFQPDRPLIESEAGDGSFLPMDFSSSFGKVLQSAVDQVCGAMTGEVFIKPVFVMGQEFSGLYLRRKAFRSSLEVPLIVAPRTFDLRQRNSELVCAGMARQAIRGLVQSSSLTGYAGAVWGTPGARHTPELLEEIEMEFAEIAAPYFESPASDEELRSGYRQEAAISGLSAELLLALLHQMPGLGHTTEGWREASWSHVPMLRGLVAVLLIGGRKLPPCADEVLAQLPHAQPITADQADRVLSGSDVLVFARVAVAKLLASEKFREFLAKGPPEVAQAE